MLAISAFQASTQSALIRANIKPPLEVVVANLVEMRAHMTNNEIEKIKQEEKKYYLEKVSDLAVTELQAREKYDRYISKDPYPEIEPALLNSADIFKYVAATGMIYPFDVEKLRGATYDVGLKGTAIWWDEEKKIEHVQELVNPGEFFELKPNSIAFITLEPFFRIPNYLVLRFNLRVTHIYKGLLLGTGPIVDPGFVGKLSIPLHNLTANTYKFTVGDDIIQMEFTKLSPNRAWVDNIERETGLYKRNWIKPGRTVREYLTRALSNSSETVIKSSIPAEIAKIFEQVTKAKDDMEKFKGSTENSMNRTQLINAALMVSVAGVAISALCHLGNVNADQQQLIYDLERTHKVLDQTYSELNQQYKALEEKYSELEKQINKLIDDGESEEDVDE